MMWTILVIWPELYDSNYEAPRLGHNGQWFKSQTECELDMVRHALIVDDYEILQDPTGVVIKFPYIGGAGNKRCVQQLMPTE